MVTDPKNYRWCGYAEAVAGEKPAQRGIMGFLEGRGWKMAGAEYRQMLFVKSGVAGRSDKKELDRETIKQAIAEGGELGLAEVLRLRIRYFSDGVALGSKEFVNSVHAEFRDHFGKARQSGARQLQAGKALSELSAMRNLRRERFG